MHNNLLDRFADGAVGVTVIGLGLYHRYGEKLIQNMVDIGLTGNTFRTYYIILERDQERLYQAVVHGSAAEWVANHNAPLRDE